MKRDIEMGSLNGVFIMLSFLARNRLHYHLQGSCPEPPKSSLLFEDANLLLDSATYYTALHYESELKGGGHIFGGQSRAKDELNCIHLTVKNVSESLILLQDCGFYEGYLASPDLINTTSYHLTLQNIDITSSCKNHTSQIGNLSVWTDPKRDFILFWSCTNDLKMTSHQQVVLVFINRRIVYPEVGQPAVVDLLGDALKFAENKLWFSRLNISDFDVNEKLMVDRNSACDFYNCTPNCGLMVETGSGAGGAFIFFIVILFVVIIVFMMVL